MPIAPPPSSRRLHGVVSVHVGDGDLRAFLGEATRDRASDAASRSGDEHHLVGKTSQCNPSSAIRIGSPLIQIS
jgi:hypothetical protein